MAMPTIQIITHHHDNFVWTDGATKQTKSSYLLYDVLVELAKRGYQPIVTIGIPKKPVGAQVAILHVDTTVVPSEYVEYAKSFPVCINSDVVDITKRRVSQAVLGPNEDWRGPVMVKSNLNCAGARETQIDLDAASRGEQRTYGNAPLENGYEIFNSIDEVPVALRDEPSFVIEKFLPEKEPDGYATRFWVFLGEGERCTRYVSPQAIVKGSNTVRSEPVPVPEELRELRRRLKFDFGKFDFVVHNGRAVLIDANKTISRPKRFSEAVMSNIPKLADGFEMLVKKQMIGIAS